MNEIRKESSESIELKYLRSEVNANRKERTQTEIAPNGEKTAKVPVNSGLTAMYIHRHSHLH